MQRELSGAGRENISKFEANFITQNLKLTREKSRLWLCGRVLVVGQVDFDVVVYFPTACALQSGTSS